MNLLSNILQVLGALKDYVVLGVSYYLGKSEAARKVLKKTLEAEIKSKQEYIKNVEEIARMSDNAVFDELRSKHTRNK